ncbi:MAG: ATP-binding protein [Lachnotalea sp.]
MKILVVDDDKLNLKIAEGYLNKFFPTYLIQICQQPKLVMGILDTEVIDIILLDIIMPEISGIEILKDIRGNPEYTDIQILMFTSMTDDESFQSCFELGANDYLKKPIQQIEFKARISAAANTRNNLLELHVLYKKTKIQNNELKNMNAQLQDMQFSLIQSEKLAAIGELAAGVAHEINNPIGYVGSNLETISNYLFKIRDFIKLIYDNVDAENESLYSLMQESYRKNKLSFVMEDIDSLVYDSKDGIQKISEIVKSLRNFAHTGLENEMNYCALSEILDQVLLIVRNEAKYVVDVKVDSIDTPDVYCNRSQISQVFLNIIINAIQAIKQQKRTDLGRVAIKVYREQEYACISIKDDGPGIPEENISKIFNPFFTTKEVGQGTGLGLSISYDIIVKKHNGIFDVESSIGKGSEFLVKLPIKKIDV